jgi:hypothetical protein
MKNIHLRKCLVGLTGLCFWVGSPAQALITESFTFTPGVTIPDGNGPLGISISNAITVTDPLFTSIGNVTVDLTISGDPAGGFNGDLFVSLTSDLGGGAVLMNRVGLDTTPPLGYAGGGVDVTFEDGAANGDIHNYEGLLGAGTPNALTQLTGTWQPDGRLASGDTARPALLSSFIGLDPSTTWTLFLADSASGTPMVLESFTITLSDTIVAVGAVPEPGTAGMLLAILLALPFIRRYQLNRAVADQ